MQEIMKKLNAKMDKSIHSLSDDFNTIRTGRASASLFDKVMVDYYGTPTPINQVASISIPEARLVVIQPWDKNSLLDIEKAIQKSELSLNPNNDGKVIRINIPPLTEDRRKDLVKQAKSMGEQSRVAIRNIRRDANDSLKKAEKELSEDEVKKKIDEVQKITDKYIEKISSLLSEKEKEIMEI